MPPPILRFSEEITSTCNHLVVGVCRLESLRPFFHASKRRSVALPFLVIMITPMTSAQLRALCKITALSRSTTTVVLYSFRIA